MGGIDGCLLMTGSVGKFRCFVSVQLRRPQFKAYHHCRQERCKLWPVHGLPPIYWVPALFLFRLLDIGQISPDVIRIIPEISVGA